MWWKGLVWFSDFGVMVYRFCYYIYRKKVLVIVLLLEDEFSVLMEYYSLLKVLRVCVCVIRFFINFRNSKLRRVKGLLIIDEMKY